MNPVAVSTCWNSHRHTDGAAMLDEIAALGVRDIELSHGVRISQLQGILRRLGQGGLRVASVHNFCPPPVEVVVDNPDALEFTDPSPARRQRAVRLTRETIDFAATVKAPAVVLHLGSAHVPAIETPLLPHLGSATLFSRRTVRRKIALLKQRAQQAPALWARVFECLDTIVPYAAAKGIRLGIETRASLAELPDETEFDAIWARYPAETVGYWHDFGHVQRKHLAFTADHHEALSRNRARLLGCHAHDTKRNLRDHTTLGRGTVPWPDLLPMLPAGVPLVLELRPKYPAEAVQTSLRLLAEWLEAARSGPAPIPAVAALSP